MAKYNRKYYEILQLARVFKFYNDCFNMVHKVAYGAKYGKGLNTLTQMLYRLPVALAKVNAGNNQKTHYME